MADVTSYSLKYPIVRDSRTGDGPVQTEVVHEAGKSLSLRRVRGRDLKVSDAETSNMEKAFVLISRITGLAIDDVRDMDAADIKALGDIVEAFTEGGPA